jgi:hypothetical protein
MQRSLAASPNFKRFAWHKQSILELLMTANDAMNVDEQ